MWFMVAPGPPELSLDQPYTCAPHVLLRQHPEAATFACQTGPRVVRSISLRTGRKGNQPSRTDRLPAARWAPSVTCQRDHSPHPAMVRSMLMKRVSTTGGAGKTPEERESEKNRVKPTTLQPARGAPKRNWPPWYRPPAGRWEPAARLQRK